jgi:hypothetical protein
MSGNLFAVKVMAIVAALRACKDKIDTNNRECRGVAVGPNDGKIRMLLWSPEVATEVRRKFEVKDCRIRFAFEAKAPSFGLDEAYLEVYDVEGNPLTDPIKAPKLDDALANAVQVELFHFLLKQHGVDIPML